MLDIVRIMLYTISTVTKQKRKENEMTPKDYYNKALENSQKTGNHVDYEITLIVKTLSPEELIEIGVVEVFANSDKKFEQKCGRWQANSIICDAR